MAPPSPLSPLLVILATIAGSGSPSYAQSNPTVWGSVVILNHGERNPSLSSDRLPVLTPLGADQMLSQGRAFRARYINPTDAGESNITESNPIRGLEQDAIDNTQLTLLSTDDHHVIAGAQAFAQGLYPPNSEAFLGTLGGEDGLSWDNLLGENVQYPLDGYQYPAVRSRSILDEASLPLQGHSGCVAWLTSVSQVDSDPEMQRAAKSSQDSLEDLFYRPPFAGMVPNDSINFFNSYQLWDYARHQITHNRSAYEDELHPDREGSPLQSLEQNALKAQQALHADAEISGLESKDNRANNAVRTVAGRTLAQGVLTAIESISIARGRSPSSSSAPKLSAMFTSFGPLLSFYPLAGLRTPRTDPRDAFYGLPEPAAAMAFEIIGDDSTVDGVPDDDSLYVRFAYRANAEPDTPFRTKTLFGASQNEWRMPLPRFRAEMARIALDVDEWCRMCGAADNLFCLAREFGGDGDLGAGEAGDGRQPENSSGVRNPVVAGVIGAVCALAFAASLGAATFALGGVRLYRKRKEVLGDGNGEGGEGGGVWRAFAGFRGAEKMASDADLTLTKGGARHERVGSWELTGGRGGEQDHSGGGPRADGDDLEGADAENTTRGDGDGNGDGNSNGNDNANSLGDGIMYDEDPGIRGSRECSKEVDEDGVSVMSADIGTLPVRPRESL